MKCPEERIVDAHFAQRISVVEERRMREHLPSCASCRARYERQLLLEKLDPTSAGAGARLAHGLGFGFGSDAQRRPGNLRFLSPRTLGLAGAVAVAASIALFYRSPKVDDTTSFSSRGSAAHDAPDILVYRGARTSEAPSRAGASIHKGDELAFAYANPGGKPYLMVFGVDEHRHVYWYYPAWNDPAAAPTSVAIEKATTPRPLPDAVRHDLDGASLDVHAVFTDRPLDVRTVEGLIASAPDGRAAFSRESGAVERTVRFRVEQ